MKYHTHLIIGATAGILIASYTGQSVLLYAIIGGVAGVMPDMDIYADKAHIAAHRGAWSHSLLASVIASILTFIPLYYLKFPTYSSLWTSLTVFSAFFLHAIADTMTYSGTYLLYPLSKRKYKGFVRYDNPVANAGLILLCLAALILLTHLSDYLRF